VEETDLARFTSIADKRLSLDARIAPVYSRFARRSWTPSRPRQEIVRGLTGRGRPRRTGGSVEVGSAVLGLAGGWAAGITLGTLYSPAPWLVLIPGLAASALAAVLAPRPFLRLLAIALTALLLGQIRTSVTSEVEGVDPLAAYAGDVSLTGLIVDAPLVRGSRIETVVEIDEISQEGMGVADLAASHPRPRVLLRVTYLRAAYGDRIETRGRLARPRPRPGWPLDQILARRGIFWVVDTGGAAVIERAQPSLVGLLGQLRGYFEANTRLILPEPHASLVAGIVFGARGGLPPDLKSAMSATGTSHLTAVSGANVAMVAGALLVLARGLVGAAPASFFAIVGVWLYTVMVGAPPSAVRAATMATCALLAQGLGRQPDALVGLLLAVAALLGWDPGLAFDLGFQLSVAATAGLILLTPSIERWLVRLPRALRAHLAVAIAAQIATLPLILGTFQRLSLVSLPANVLAAPMIPPIMVLGVAIAAFGWMPLLDVVLGWSAWLVTSALLAVIETSAQIPGGIIAVGRAPAWLPLWWYLVLGCWAAAGSPDIKGLGVRPEHLRITALGGALLLPILALVPGPTSARDGEARIVLLETDPAAAFLRLPAGGSVLLVTASGARGLNASVGGQLDLQETGVDIEIGPDGVRTAVSLLEVGGASGQAGGEDADSSRTAGPSPYRPDRQAPPVIDLPTTAALLPGARIVLDDRLAVEIINIRQMGQRDVLDLAIVADGLTVLLPGPGTPGLRWDELEPNTSTIAVLPSSAVSWARTLSPRNWLLVVGEPLLERTQSGSAVPFLARRQHGAIEIAPVRGKVAVRSERCADGLDCEIELAPPIFGSLLAQSVDHEESTVQSGRTDGGR
jgi:competence protein ComEC